MLTFDEALKRVLALASRLSSERVALDDACGRVLAADVLAPADVPAFDYSAMDGYAVQSGDWTDSGPVELPLRGEVRAGTRPPTELALGTAVRIFTGGPMPLGADAVVMQENVERAGEIARFRERPKAGQHIRRRGEDLTAGAPAVVAGTRLRPAHVGLAASCECAWTEVARRPVVSVLGNGDELRPPGAAGVPGSIADSNGPAIRAMAARAGAYVRVAASVRDDRAAMASAFEGALRGTDLLVTIGGVSVGDHDLVRPVLESLGAQIDFWRVAIKPGKPLLVGRRGDAVVLGLPGNPSSAMVTFALFGVPLLRAMQGDMRAFPAFERARAGRDIPHAPGRQEFLRATVARDETGWVASPVANQASGASTSMAQADVLVSIETDRGPVKAGEPVGILWLDELGA